MSSQKKEKKYNKERFLKKIFFACQRATRQRSDLIWQHNVIKTLRKGGRKKMYSVDSEHDSWSFFLVLSFSLLVMLYL